MADKGQKINPTSHMPLKPLNKEDFKYWKPWLPEHNIPEWAEKLQSAPLGTVLGTKNKPIQN